MQPRAKRRGSAKAQWLTLLTTSGSPESKTSNTCEKHGKGCEIGAEGWLVQKVELSEECVAVNHQFDGCLICEDFVFTDYGLLHSCVFHGSAIEAHCGIIQ